MRSENNPQTPKFLAFKEELAALCLKHRVMLGSSLYDSPAVFDMGPDESPIHYDDLSDFTDEVESKETA